MRDMPSNLTRKGAKNLGQNRCMHAGLEARTYSYIWITRHKPYFQGVKHLARGGPAGPGGLTGSMLGTIRLQLKTPD
ncbi:salivary gland secretion 1 [Moniliophthora roreri]|nr:salivary gland secretion 1 [Moniliophthora roreri]